MITITELLEKFDILKQFRFEIVAGKKGKIDILEVKFDDSCFKHLVGIHKLIDLQQYADNRISSAYFCSEVRKGTITQAELNRSRYFAKVSFEEEDPPIKRFEAVSKLFSLLESYELDVYKISKGSIKTIRADYQLHFLCEENIRLFLVLDSKQKYYYPVTVIFNENPIYNGELKTLLYLSFYQLKSKTRKTIFKHKTYTPKFDDQDRLTQ